MSPRTVTSLCLAAGAFLVGGGVVSVLLALRRIEAGEDWVAAPILIALGVALIAVSIAKRRRLRTAPGAGDTGQSGGGTTHP